MVGVVLVFVSFFGFTCFVLFGKLRGGLSFVLCCCCVSVFFLSLVLFVLLGLVCVELCNCFLHFFLSFSSIFIIFGAICFSPLCICL